MNSKCIIWGTEAFIEDKHNGTEHKHIYHSHRAGGKYIIDHKMHFANSQNELNLKDEEKIRLSGYIARENLNCDLTSEEGKPRGSVYFEAGYAMGKDIPIIWTCRKEAIKDESQKSQSEQDKSKIELAFDIRQYNCLVWEDSEKDDFIKELKNRIENAIGPGPLKEKQSKDKTN